MSRRRRWCLPLLAFAAVVALDWVRLHFSGVITPSERQHLYLLIGVTIAVSIAIKLVYSRAWPLQELGHLGVLAGLASLVLRFLGRYGPQPPPEWERDLTQALLDVGAAALLVGMVLWVIFHRHDGETGEEGTVLYERRQGQRRQGFGRRKEDQRP